MPSRKSFPFSRTPHRRWPRRVPDGVAVAPGGLRIDAQPIRLRFSGTLRGFERAFAHLRAALDGQDLKFAARSRFDIELVFEEIVGNIVRYGAPHGGELRVEVLLKIGGDCIAITFEDDGMPFDPSGRTDPPVPTTLADAPDGGFGLMIVRHTASVMRYERTANQRNRLVVTLNPDTAQHRV